MAKTLLPRRLVIRGLGGLGVILPALEFTHGKAWAQAAPAVAKRFITFFDAGGYISNVTKDGRRYDGTGSQNGVDLWKSTGIGENLVLSQTHAPLAGLEPYLLQLRGVDNLACKHQSPYDGDHGFANVSALTHAKITLVGGTGGDAARPDTESIDSVLATRLAIRNPVPFPMINLMVSAHSYGTPYYFANRQRNEGEVNPTTAFSKIFAGVTDGAAPDPAIARARALKLSVLDGTKQTLATFKNKVSSQDKASIDAHLDHIRGIEQQLSAMGIPAVGCTKPTLTGPFGDNLNYTPNIPNVAAAHADIIVAAFRCGLTNVANLELGDFSSPWLSPPLAADIGHTLHHYSTVVGKAGTKAYLYNDWLKSMLDNRVARTKMVKRILDGLKSTPEGAGNMLDNSLLLWTSEFSAGGEHGVSDLPIMLAGKAGGAIRTGRVVNYNLKAGMTPEDYQTSATLGNLYTSVLNAFGYPDTSFGGTFGDFSDFNGKLIVKSKTGPLPNLT